ADTKIHAPFNGYVARRYTDNHVNVRAGENILRLNDLSELFVIASMPESMLATVTAERIVSLYARFAFLPDEIFELTYRENTGEAAAVAQTFEVTFAMPRPEAWNILPGMTATVEVELSATASSTAVRVPISALVADANKQFFVWLYDAATNAVEKRTVEVGPAEGKTAVIRAGLKGGELLVATGASQLQAGMKVRALGEPVEYF
ncbi:MAG: efflux RND transporter periplasmic adaptor subunit, partial [Pseudomonadota bacterium]